MLDSLTENETRLILRNWTTSARAFQIIKDARFKIIEGDYREFLWEGFAEHYWFLWYSSPVEAIIAHKFAKKNKVDSVLIEDLEYSDKFLVMVPRKFAEEHFCAQV